MKAILILKKRRQQDIKNEEENLDIVSSQGYYAIKDPDWSGRNTPNTKYSKKKKQSVYVRIDKENHLEQHYS